MQTAATDSTPPPGPYSLPPGEMLYTMEQTARALGWYLPNGKPNTRRASRHMLRKPCVAVKRGGRWYTSRALLRRRRPEESHELIARLDR